MCTDLSETMVHKFDFLMWHYMEVYRPRL